MENKIKELLEDCKFPKREKEEMEKYLIVKEYPKGKTDQIAFYRAYRKIRTITRLGNRLIEFGMMKK